MVYVIAYLISRPFKTWPDVYFLRQGFLIFFVSLNLGSFSSCARVNEPALYLNPRPERSDVY